MLRSRFITDILSTTLHSPLGGDVLDYSAAGCGFHGHEIQAGLGASLIPSSAESSMKLGRLLAALGLSRALGTGIHAGQAGARLPLRAFQAIKERERRCSTKPATELSEYSRLKSLLACHRTEFG